MCGEAGAEVRIGAYGGGTALGVGRMVGVGVRERGWVGSGQAEVADEAAGHDQFVCRKSGPRALLTEDKVLGFEEMASESNRRVCLLRLTSEANTAREPGDRRGLW